MDASTAIRASISHCTHDFEELSPLPLPTRNEIRAQAAGAAFLPELRRKRPASTVLKSNDGLCLTALYSVI
jgi:hypothetical protein